MTGPHDSNEGGSIWLLLLAMSPVLLVMAGAVGLWLRFEWKRWKRRREKRNGGGK